MQGLIDSVAAGLDFLMGLAAAPAGIVCVAGDDGAPRVLVDRRGGSPLLKAAHGELWRRAEAAPTLPVELSARRVAAWAAGPPLCMVCVELPGRIQASALATMASVAWALTELATARRRPAARESLTTIHMAADPAATLTRLLDEVDGNVAALARRLGCRRQTLYAVAEKYSVRLARRC